MNKHRLILLELNEINMDVARTYADALHLRNFQTLFQQESIETTSEKRYDDIEPWIQWVSVHTGLTATEHGIFRLGDIVKTEVPQLFEQVEALGYSVGALSPMNASNRLKKPSYFIPDPWTYTEPDPSHLSHSLTEALRQSVNDNASGKITTRSLGTLALAVLRFASTRNYKTYARLAITSRRKPWRRAMFLDLLLHDLHLALFNSKKPAFSTLFLNGGAHTQHHYFLNAKHCEQPEATNPEWYVAKKIDPMGEMLVIYDRIIGDYLRLKTVDLIVATGLSQIPYRQPQFYWRLRDHAAFLKMLNIDFTAVAPRMTRDFEIQFSSPDSASKAEQCLRTVRVAGTDTRLFEEVDNRGDSLFVTLTWPNDVVDNTSIESAGRNIPLKPYVVFVAIKNGVHSPKGYVYMKGRICGNAPAQRAHVAALHNTVLDYFRHAN